MEKARRDRLLRGAGMTALVVIAAIATRGAVGKTWKKAAGRPAPPARQSQDAPMREELGWALASGVAVGLARMLVRRGATRTARAARG